MQARVFNIVLVTLFIAACQSAYYATWEKLGYHKRDILVERVEEARDDQQEAKEQFVSALEAFQSVVAFDGGDLEAVYDRLSAELQRCEADATSVRDRIDSIESVATALFEEWESELDQYSSESLRRQSEEQLHETESRYGELMGAMRRAESTMEPVLVSFRDHVLFLKHNLNAQAIASLHGEAVNLQDDVDVLIAEMEAAIAEADSFIAAMSGS